MLYHVNSVNHVNIENHVNIANNVNIVNSVFLKAAYSAALPPSLMVFVQFSDGKTDGLSTRSPHHSENKEEMLRRAIAMSYQNVFF